MSKGRPSRPRTIAVAWILAAILGAPAGASSNRPSSAQAAIRTTSGTVAAVTPSPSLPSVPPGAPPPGVREPVVGSLGVLAILVTAAAGFFIYAQIRRGL